MPEEARQGAQVGADVERAERLTESGREPATDRGGRARNRSRRGRGLVLRSVRGGVVDARECLLVAMTATGLGSVGPLGAGHGLSWCFGMGRLTARVIVVDGCAQGRMRFGADAFGSGGAWLVSRG